MSISQSRTVHGSRSKECRNSISSLKWSGARCSGSRTFLRSATNSVPGELPFHMIQDVTDLFRDTKSTVLKKAKKIHALTLKGFAGLVGREIQPERRLGSEMSDYAKKCGVGGIFHTDELPAYGITAEEVAKLRSHLGCRGRGLRNSCCRGKRETSRMRNHAGYPAWPDRHFR